jgi:hypothetical protein
MASHQLIVMTKQAHLVHINHQVDFVHQVEKVCRPHNIKHTDMLQKQQSELVPLTCLLGKVCIFHQPMINLAHLECHIPTAAQQLAVSLPAAQQLADPVEKDLLKRYLRHTLHVVK